MLFCHKTQRKRHSRVEALNLVCNCLSEYINYIVNYLLSKTETTRKGLTSAGCKADTQPGLQTCWRGQSLHREETGKTETLRTQSACEVLACSFLIALHIYGRYYYPCAPLTTWDWSPYPPFLLPSLHFFFSSSLKCYFWSTEFIKKFISVCPWQFSIKHILFKKKNTKLINHRPN